MTPLEKRVRRVYSCSDLDPDFGEVHPDAAEVYQIKVVPSTVHVPRYSFMALLPNLGSEDDTLDLLKEVLPDFLDPEDGFMVLDFTDEALEEWKSNGSCGPILSYDPRTLDGEQIDFLWLFPPKHQLS